MLKKIVILLLMVLISKFVFAQEKTEDFGIGEKFRLQSKIPNEERTYWVHLPISYNDPTFTLRPYPVLYLVDGEIYFLPASGIVQFMNSGINCNNQIPELIIVAITNTDRTRDLTPTASKLSCSDKEDHFRETSGGGSNFLKFLRDELFPQIESRYRTLAYRIIAGQSDGGLLAVQALLESPEMFNSYIATDPGLWWDKRVLVNRLQREFKRTAKPPISVFLSMSNNVDIGFGSPRINEEANSRFRQLLKLHKLQSFRSTIRYFENEDHASFPLISLYYGLLYIFEGYKLPLKKVIDQPSFMTTHFKHLSENWEIRRIKKFYEKQKITRETIA